MAWVDTRVPTSYGAVVAVVIRVACVWLCAYAAVAVLSALFPISRDGKVCWGGGLWPFHESQLRCVAVTVEDD